LLDDGRPVLVQSVLDLLGLGPLGHRLDPVAKVSLAVHLRARRDRSLRPVFLGPLLKLSLARALIPQLGILALKVLSLPHFPDEITPKLNLLLPVRSSLVNLIPRPVYLLDIAFSDVDLFPVYLPGTHPDVDVGVIRILVDHRKRLCIGKRLL
jgi:hypothetical protein